MPNEIFTKVPHIEYMKLIERCDTLEKEVARLTAELRKAKAVKVAKVEPTTETKGDNKTKTKKGGNEE